MGGELRMQLAASCERLLAAHARALVQVRHEHYVAEFTSHISEEERQKQAEAEFKVGMREQAVCACVSTLFPRRYAMRNALAPLC